MGGGFDQQPGAGSLFTDAEVNRQAKMLAESGASKDDVKDFRDRAAMAMTPKQLERLAAEKAPSR